MKIADYMTRAKAPFPLFTVDLSGSDAKLQRIGKESGTGLSVDELKRVRDYFKKEKRDPTDVELQSLGQAWSEHCCYKSSRNTIKEHMLGIGKSRIIDRGDAGIMEFDKDNVYAIRIESHNHPSAVEPYGGAATGIGGIVRDVLCMGCQPVALVDPLFFGPLDTPQSKLPAGTKHPRYLTAGVVAGIRDYGNRIGIPTVSGGIWFHPLYTGNCLVNVGCVGIAPKKRLYKNRVGGVGDKFVLVGGYTGRDGIHGVTFASAELDERSEEESRGAVQLGDPITKEPLMHAVLEVAERGLITGMKDLGGGGLSCVVGELALAAGFGAKVHLDKVHLKEEGMAPWEIWVSESQERMMLAVKEKDLPKVLEVFDLYDIPARVVGEVVRQKRSTVLYKGVQVLDVDLEFLTGGPVYCRPMKARARTAAGRRKVPAVKDASKLLLALLSDHDICSREWVIRQYDHEVRGATVLKPLQGKLGFASHGDAAVIRPVEKSMRGLAIGVGANPRLCEADPRRGGKGVVAEAIANVASVGARPDAFSNCLNFGNPEKPDRFGDFVEAVKGMADAAGEFAIPTPSGNVSFYNETPKGAIPPTPVVMMVGIVDDVSKAVTSDLKLPGNPLYVLGESDPALGGSLALAKLGGSDTAPDVDLPRFKRTVGTLLKAAGKGMLASCHDVSAGGLAVAMTEMAMGGDLGLDIQLNDASPGVLFGEGAGRFVVEVQANKAEAFERLTGLAPIGSVTKVRKVSVKTGKKAVISLPLDKARKAWSSPLWEAMG